MPAFKIKKKGPQRPVDQLRLIGRALSHLMRQHSYCLNLEAVQRCGRFSAAKFKTNAESSVMVWRCGPDMIQENPLTLIFIHSPASKAHPMAKSTCPVTRAEFVNDAKPVEVVINGIPMTAEVKEFSTGSLGWYLNGKANIKVGEKSVSVQIGMNLTIVGSKELPK